MDKSKLRTCIGCGQPVEEDRCPRCDAERTSVAMPERGCIVKPEKTA